MKRQTASQVWRNGRLAVLIGLGVAGVLFAASEAKAAGCVVPDKAGFATAAVASAHASVATHEAASQNGASPATIVGMWHVTYTATYATAGPIPVPVIPPGPPDSFQFAETMKTWHADGTEWEEKIQPAPAGFCFGVWSHAANNTAKLHHFGAITGPDGSVVAIFWQDEVNRVAPDGTTYSGTWDFRLYAPNDVFGAGPVLQQITGTTAATRITVQ